MSQGGGEGGSGAGFDLLALLAFLPSVISSFSPEIRGGGGAGDPGASPRSVTGTDLTTSLYLKDIALCDNVGISHDKSVKYP